MYDCIMRLKVLIIDDDSYDLKMLKEYVSELGHNPFTASSGEEAINICKEYYKKLNPIDVALIDYMMPDLDGIYLADRLREIDSSLIIMSITADNSQETKTNLINSKSIDCFLSKIKDLDYLSRYFDIAMATKKQRLSGEKSVFRNDRKSGE